MNFLFQLYTDVSAWQLFGGWVLAGGGIPILAVFYWNVRSDLKHFLWLKKSQWPPEVYATMLRDRDEHLSAANDKVRSLEARIEKLISRPRAKNGRFEKKERG